MIKQLSILGYRGYSTKQKVTFSIPNNNLSGSGLTFIVGANNSGKTTIIECLKAFSAHSAPTFSERKRNSQADERVHISLITDDGVNHEIRTVEAGGSSTYRNPKEPINIYTLQSRRYVPHEFDKSTYDRSAFTLSALLNNRGYQLEGFQYRLFTILENKVEFDKLLHKVLPKTFNWTIDQSDSGQFFIKFTYNGLSHSGEGVGDGVWSLFTICDALYDSSPGSITLIDEPELSIHPAYQRKLMALFNELSQDRQIIICTHSPYFINWTSIANGASLLRTAKNINGSIDVYNLKNENKHKIKGIISDRNNPHTLGLNANEVFFLEDGIILVEGQEDVVTLRELTSSIPLNAELFGWGVGGASKMDLFLSLFNNLGYSKICVVLDGDQKQNLESLKEKYPNYKFVLLPEDDIRDKDEKASSPKTGITTSKGELKPKHEPFFKNMINEINTYMSSNEIEPK